jgi:hypothetical protein
MTTATSASNGAFAAMQAGMGGASTGIGIGSAKSGAASASEWTSSNTADVIASAIGSGATASSASNLGNMVQEPLAFTAGSGYTNGTYTVNSTGGGQADGAAAVSVVVAGGAITSVTLLRAGSGFTSAPTFPVTGLGAGTLGVIGPATIGLGSRILALNAAPAIAQADNKGLRQLTADGNVATNAAITPGTYLNRSGRAMVLNDSAWGTAP